jgi:hypothetical protein
MTYEYTCEIYSLVVFTLEKLKLSNPLTFFKKFLLFSFLPIIMTAVLDEIVHLDAAIKISVDLKETLQSTLDHLQKLNKKYNADYIDSDDEVDDDSNSNESSSLNTIDEQNNNEIESTPTAPKVPRYILTSTPVTPKTSLSTFFAIQGSRKNLSARKTSARRSKSNPSLQLHRSTSEVSATSNEIGTKMIKIKRNIEAALIATENASRIHQKRNYNFIQTINNQDVVYNVPIIIQNYVVLEKRFHSVHDLIRKWQNKYNIYQTCDDDYQKLIESLRSN